MKYALIYRLRNQSKVFSQPQVFETDDHDEIAQAICIAKSNGYEIIDVKKENELK